MKNFNLTPMSSSITENLRQFERLIEEAKQQIESLKKKEEVKETTVHCPHCGKDITPLIDETIRETDKVVREKIAEAVFDELDDYDDDDDEDDYDEYCDELDCDEEGDPMHTSENCTKCFRDALLNSYNGYRYGPSRASGIGNGVGYTPRNEEKKPRIVAWGTIEITRSPNGIAVEINHHELKRS